MVNVVGVRFKTGGKVYYFDPGEFVPEPGAGVIVETARGLEFGTVTMGITAVNRKDISKPLKKIVRIADEKDIARHEENEKKKSKAMVICQEKIHKHGLEMKLIDVEYTFDNNKVIFYFTAEGRVDFRELVKDLASTFRMRIELRQVGVRDEAKILGGVGSCGKGLCCATWLKDFEPVSIKMAKVQNLSLNPSKISGVCGRLMCCLKYENDMYLELRKDMPDQNERVMTSEGLGKVIESDVMQGRVKVRIYSDEKGDNGELKLGSDVFVFGKDEVERINKKGARKPKPEEPPKQKAGASEEEGASAGAEEAGGKSRNRNRRRRRRGKKNGSKPAQPQAE